MISEVGETRVNLITKLAMGKKAGLARQSLDGHALEDGLERLKLLGEGDNGICTREEASGGRHQEGREGVVVGTGISEDLEWRRACGERTHCVGCGVEMGR